MQRGAVAASELCLVHLISVLFITQEDQYGQRTIFQNCDSTKKKAHEKPHIRLRFVCKRAFLISISCTFMCNVNSPLLGK